MSDRILDEVKMEAEAAGIIVSDRELDEIVKNAKDIQKSLLMEIMHKITALHRGGGENRAKELAAEHGLAFKVRSDVTLGGNFKELYFYDPTNAEAAEIFNSKNWFLENYHDKYIEILSYRTGDSFLSKAYGREDTELEYKQEMLFLLSKFFGISNFNGEWLK